MPDGIRPLKDQTGAARIAARLRPIATALLFLLLWAGTLGPAAMAAAPAPGLASQIEHGGETPPTQEAMPSFSLTRTSTRAHPTATESLVMTSTAGTPASLRRRSPHRIVEAGPDPRRASSRGRRRGRAPPR